MAVQSTVVRWFVIAVFAAGQGVVGAPGHAAPRIATVVDQLTVGGPGVLVEAGRKAAAFFDATAGQKLAVVVLRKSLSARDNTDLVIRRDGTKPDGAKTAEGTLLTTWSAVTADFTVPASGRYTVYVIPRDKDRGTVLLQLAGTTEGVLARNGAARKVGFQHPGERAVFAFDAKAGEALTLVAWRGTLPKDEYTHLEVRGPGGGVDTAGAVGYDSGFRTLDFVAEAAGRHTVEINPDTVHTGTLTVRLVGTVSAGISEGKPARITLARAGERAFITFRAAEGDQFRLVARRETLTTGEQTWLRLRTPAGLEVADGILSKERATATLGFSSSAGTYRLEVDPEGLDTGTLTLDLRRI